MEEDATPAVLLTPRTLVLKVRPGTDAAKRQELIEEWYRVQIQTAVEPLIARWEPRLGVEVRRVFVQRMKTKWGSCSPAPRSIRLNTELAKKPRECLEYIVVHEMIHLLEPTHGERFVSILDDCLPRWRQRRDSLNRLPVRHEHWSY